VVCAGRNGEQESNVVIFPVYHSCWLRLGSVCWLLYHPTSSSPAHFDTKDGGSVYPQNHQYLHTRLHSV
jgi:hypothetical protein